MAILGAVFANDFFHHFTGIPRFVWVLREWGFESRESRRMVARGVIAFEGVSMVCLIAAVGTGITNNRRFGRIVAKAAQACVVGVLLFLQIVTVLYLVEKPLYCGCGPLARRIDGWIEELWMYLQFDAPESSVAIPVTRNILLSLAAVGALMRARVKKPHE